MSNPPILLVEDDEDFVLLVRRALRKAGITDPIQIVTCGEQALEYLSGTGRYNDWRRAPLPSMVLLDLKMPGMSGFDLLKWIREQPGIKALRVAILASSTLERDTKRAYDLGANIYLPKPVDSNKLTDMMAMLYAHFLQQAQPPEVTRSLPGSQP